MPKKAATTLVADLRTTGVQARVLTQAGDYGVQLVVKDRKGYRTETVFDAADVGRVLKTMGKVA